MKSHLLLLHGALGSEKQFDSLRPLLEDRFTVHTINFAGHGGREDIREFSMNLFVDNVIDYLDERDLSTIDVFGYSMGGYVALTLAAAHPGRLGRIITLGTKFNWDPESTARELKMLNPDVVELKVPGFAKKLSEDHTPVDWKENMRKTARMMKRLSEGEALTQDILRSIENPVIIGIGDQDKMVSVRESEKVSEIIAQGRLRILEGVVHPIDRVDPHVITRYILQEI